jgi:hypothetical protein
MTHRRLVLLVVPLVLVAVLLPGCVPVTEPLSDPDKAKRVERLLGKWESIGNRDRGWHDCEIDCPPVKDNPKGLMRAVLEGKADDPKNTFWFFTTTIGKHTYATIYVEPHDKWEDIRYPDFRKEGAFKKWNKGKNRRYFIFRYVLDGDKLTVDGGGPAAVLELMEAEKIGNVVPRPAGGWPGLGPSSSVAYATPPGWLAKYLEKNGPKTLYDGTGGPDGMFVFELRRPKK